MRIEERGCPQITQITWKKELGYPQITRVEERGCPQITQIPQIIKSVNGGDGCEVGANHTHQFLPISSAKILRCSCSFNLRNLRNLRTISLNINLPLVHTNCHNCLV